MSVRQNALSAYMFVKRILIYQANNFSNFSESLVNINYDELKCDEPKVHKD